MPRPSDTISNLTAVQQVGSSASNYDFTYKGIAWSGEAKKYGNTRYSLDEIEPPWNWQARFPNGYNETNLPNLNEDEHFHNWMRTAGLPTFTKLYGRNDDDTLRAGTYRLSVTMGTSQVTHGAIFSGTNSVLRLNRLPCEAI